MNRRILIIPLFLFLLLIRVQIVAQPISDIVEEVENSVVMIIIYDVTGSAIGQGSGVFITENGVILTNAHVLKNAYSAEIFSSLGNFDLVEILYSDEAKDLAIVQVPTPNSISPIFAENTDFRPGQRVVAIGNPLGLEKTVSDGLISGLRRTEDGIEYIQTSVPISPGSSGGVLLNEYGEFIGITTSSFSGAQNINFAISLNTIYIFLDDFMKSDSKSILLKRAKESVWYRIILHWIWNIFLVLIALLFGDNFYFIIPLAIIGGYIIYGLIKGIWWLISYPFRKTKGKRDIKSFKDYDTGSDSSNLSNSDNLGTEIGFEEENMHGELESEYIEFYCPKCGNRIRVNNNGPGELIMCEFCGKEIMVPFD